MPSPHFHWTDISMDFVTGLPLSQGHDTILVVTCRDSKECHYIPCRAGDEGTSSETTAQLLIDNVWRLHGLPLSIVSDRGTQFTSAVWKQFCSQLRLSSALSWALSTSFNPQTDGQTQPANADLATYLRMFVNHLQDD